MKKIFLILFMLMVYSSASAGGWNDLINNSSIISKAEKRLSEDKTKVEYVVKGVDETEIILKTIVIADRISQIETQINSLQNKIEALEAEKTELEALQAEN